MGLLDGLKKMGNGISNFLNDAQICKEYFSGFSDEDLIDMLRARRFDKNEPCEKVFSNFQCSLAVKMILKDRGYSQEYINSIAR